MLQIDWAAREVAGDLARHHHPAITCRDGEWLDGVMIFGAGFETPRLDRRHTYDGLAFVAHDAFDDETPLNGRRIVGVLGREIKIDGRWQPDAHGVFLL